MYNIYNYSNFCNRYRLFDLKKTFSEGTDEFKEEINKTSYATNAYELKYQERKNRGIAIIFSTETSFIDSDTLYFKLNTIKKEVRHYLKENKEMDTYIYIGAKPYFVFEDYKQRTKYLEELVKIVNQDIGLKYSTIAILCKSELECERVKRELDKKDINSQIIKNDKEASIRGVNVLTVYDSKGLEFDSVIINNASEKCFNSKDLIDMKMLYVALTRATSKLSVLSNGPITNPLKSLCLLSERSYPKDKLESKGELSK